MRRSIVVAAALLSGLLGALPALAATRQVDPEPAVEVAVERDGTLLHIDVSLPADAPVWAFARSSLIMESRQPWRLEQWRVLTPGVLLERIGDYDVLRAEGGGPVPRQIEIEARPRHETLEADYSILTFTDGSIAVPTGIFDLIALDSMEAAAALPADLNGFDIAAGPARIRWSDRAGQVLFMGERYDGVSSQGAETYILFGQAEMTLDERMATVVDPELPGWITQEIQTLSPRVADYYADRLGPGAFDRPTIMASWNGPTPNLVSLGGSVMPGLIVMSLEGEGVVEEQTAIRSELWRFISHEAAHFWLGQTVRYAFARDAWITEGGADLMAYHASVALDPDFDAAAEIQGALDNCETLAIAPVSEAGQRGEHRAFYACGAVFALVAQGVQRRATGGDWFDFLRPLMEQNRDDGILTRQEWLDHLTQVSGDPSLAADIALLLDQGATDPQPVLAGLFARSGIDFHVEDGRLRLD